MHVKHGKCIFVPQGENSRMCTISLNLMMQKGSRVIQMIVVHIFLILFTYLKGESKNKVAMAVELSIMIKDI